VTLCTFHHQLVHEGGWTVELRKGGDLRVCRPDGRELVWPTQTRAPRGFSQFEIPNVGPETGLTRWNGRSPDYALCVTAVVP
ncbi:MAG: hypothetical protein KC586_26315, partial [Myxococcales bacterium]|nr:hypothetical protein [Myxococcales bacterium]